MKSIRHYKDYYWKDGRPRGKDPIEADTPESYKIVADPYYKHISIESYQPNGAVEIIYDSLQLDFRSLKQVNMSNWEKKVIFQSDKEVRSLIRNQDDRIIFQEVYHFENKLCRSCTIKAIQGHTLAKQKILYKTLNDPFNGVILFDANEKPVMYKQYEIDSENAFTNLIKEEWNMVNG